MGSREHLPFAERETLGKDVDDLQWESPVLVEREPSLTTQEFKRQKHGNLPFCHDFCVFNKLKCLLVRWVRDDVLSPCCESQEVTSLSDVALGHIVTGVRQNFDDGSAPASRFQDRSFEGFSVEKSIDRPSRSAVEVCRVPIRAKPGSRSAVVNDFSTGQYSWDRIVSPFLGLGGPSLHEPRALRTTQFE